MSLQVELESYLTHLGIERGLSKNTIAAYRRDLNQFLLPIESYDQISIQALEDFVASLRRKGLAESSIARSVVAIRNFVDFFAKESKTINPIKEYAPPKIPKRLPKALTIEEVTSIIEHSYSEANPQTLRDKAIVELLYATGGRVSEIANLNLSDVAKLEGDEVTSIRLFGKGGKYRVVPVGRYAQQSLDEYLVRIRPSLTKGRREEALFLNNHGRRLSRQTIWSQIQESSKRAGIKREVTPHSLRHSFATHLLDGGADIRVVQELLGHASVTTTQIYTLVTIDRLRESYSTAHPRARK